MNEDFYKAVETIVGEVVRGFDYNVKLTDFGLVPESADKLYEIVKTMSVHDIIKSFQTSLTPIKYRQNIKGLGVLDYLIETTVTVSTSLSWYMSLHVYLVRRPDSLLFGTVPPGPPQKVAVIKIDPYIYSEEHTNIFNLEMYQPLIAANSIHVEYNTLMAIKEHIRPIIRAFLLEGVTLYENHNITTLASLYQKDLKKSAKNNKEFREKFSEMFAKICEVSFTQFMTYPCVLASVKALNVQERVHDADPEIGPRNPDNIPFEFIKAPSIKKITGRETLIGIRFVHHPINGRVCIQHRIMVWSTLKHAQCLIDVYVECDKEWDTEFDHRKGIAFEVPTDAGNSIFIEIGMSGSVSFYHFDDGEGSKIFNNLKIKLHDASHDVDMDTEYDSFVTPDQYHVTVIRPRQADLPDDWTR